MPRRGLFTPEQYTALQGKTCLCPANLATFSDDASRARVHIVLETGIVSRANDKQREELRLLMEDPMSVEADWLIILPSYICFKTRTGQALPLFVLPEAPHPSDAE